MLSPLTLIDKNDTVGKTFFHQQRAVNWHISAKLGLYQHAVQYVFKKLRKLEKWMTKKVAGLKNYL